MKEIRIRCTMLLVWIATLTYAGLFGNSLGLSSGVGIIAVALALPIILFPRLNGISLRWLLVSSAPVFLVLQAWWTYPIDLHRTPAVLIQLGILAVTVVLAHRLGQGLEHLRRCLAIALAGHAAESPQRIETGQAEIYREIRRARMHHRPLALMTVRAANHVSKATLDRFATQVASEMTRDYIAARIATFLDGELSDCDVIVQHDDHLVVLLPETGRDELDRIAQKLKAAAKEQLDLEFEFGLSVFPDEEITFAGLLEHAKSGRNGNGKRDVVTSRPGERLGGPTNTRGDANIDSGLGSPAFAPTDPPASVKSTRVVSPRAASSGNDDSPKRSPREGKPW